VNTKPGTGKTTTAAALAHALHLMGLDVAVVDADLGGSRLPIPKQVRTEEDGMQRLQRWDHLATFPFPVAALPTRDLHRILAGIADQLGVDHIVIDCPPIEEQTSIALSAIKAATTVVVCMAPSGAEEDAGLPIFDIIEDVTAILDDQPNTVVMLNRCPPLSPGVTKATKTVLREEGRTVLAAHVNYNKQWLRAYGKPVEVAATPYQGAAMELLDLEEATEASMAGVA
jgi:chromosome partitioning protein